jgi:hypothetical protein
MRQKIWINVIIIVLGVMTGVLLATESLSQTYTVKGSISVLGQV